MRTARVHGATSLARPAGTRKLRTMVLEYSSTRVVVVVVVHLLSIIQCMPGMILIMSGTYIIPVSIEILVLEYALDHDDSVHEDYLE